MLSCGKPLPQFENMDLNAWKDDRFGCQGRRHEQLTPFLQQKEKLLALKESQIIKLLGKPEENELFKRNQKFFRYYLQGSKNCPGDSISVQKLVLRFTAMGLCNEVTVE